MRDQGGGGCRVYEKLLHLGYLLKVALTGLQWLLHLREVVREGEEWKKNEVVWMVSWYKRNLFEEEIKKLCFGYIKVDVEKKRFLSILNNTTEKN